MWEAPVGPTADTLENAVRSTTSRPTQKIPSARPNLPPDAGATAPASTSGRQPTTRKPRMARTVTCRALDVGCHCHVAPGAVRIWLYGFGDFRVRATATRRHCARHRPATSTSCYAATAFRPDGPVPRDRLMGDYEPHHQSVNRAETRNSSMVISESALAIRR